MARELRSRGLVAGRKRVAEVVREQGLQGRRRRRYGGTTTQADPTHPVAENLLERQFSTEAPDRVWVADINHLPTAAAWAYLAVLIDLFSRKVVGWALDDVIDTRLYLRALERAFAARTPAPGLIHHPDRGCQYASRAYQDAPRERGLVSSMSRKGDWWDNAVAESFFGTLKQEPPLDEPRLSVQDVRRMISAYFFDFYNSKRLHSTHGFRTPPDHERAFHEAPVKPEP